MWSRYPTQLQNPTQLQTLQSLTKGKKSLTMLARIPNSPSGLLQLLQEVQWLPPFVSLSLSGCVGEWSEGETDLQCIQWFFIFWTAVRISGKKMFQWGTKNVTTVYNGITLPGWECFFSEIWFIWYPSLHVLYNWRSGSDIDNTC